MKEQILQLCRRINCFTLDKLETITDLDRSELLPVLNELVSDNTISELNGQYLYVKKVPEIQKHSLFQYYNSNIIEIIIRCFCASIPSYKASVIANIGADQARKFYKIFRIIIYNIQEKELKSYYKNKPQIARNRTFFDSEMYFYIYNNVVYVSDVIFKDKNEINFTLSEIREFKIIASYLSRCAFHNQTKFDLKEKLAEFLWRRNKKFNKLYFDLKNMLA